MSTTILPLLRPAATPLSLNSAVVHVGVSGTMMMTMSARSATPRALVHGVALLATMLSGILPSVKTNSWWPALIRWPAIGAPMMPRPTKPILRGEVVMSGLSLS